MRRAPVLAPLSLVLAGVLATAADDTGRARPVDSRPDYIPFDDPKLVELVKKLDAADAYVPPPMELRKDENYAATAEDREPFSGVKPYKENFLLQMEYTGSGRGIPEPEHLDSVRVGFIGPIMSTVSVATGGKSHEEALGIPMLQGARLAVEEWNARGGYLKRKIPFELVVSNDNGLWGASGNEIVKQAYQDHVWGILGTIDGANSHIAIRVALKAEVLVVNSGDTDPTFIETNIPWVVRVIGDDRQQAYLLTDYWYRKLGLERVAIIRSSNRYGRFGVREIRDSARRLGRPVPIEMAYRVGQADFRLELERIKNSHPDAVVHWGDALEGALILNTMREMGMTQPFYGCDRTVSDEFVEIAGKNAEGVVAAFPWNPDRPDPKLARFKKSYRERFGMEAETYAAHAYDGMNLMLWAIQVAGLNRARIRDVVAFLPHPWPGVTGDIVLSACLDDVADTYLATYHDGSWKYVSRAELGIPKGYIAPRDRVNRESSSREGPDPYKRAGAAPLEFRGPGRDTPEPEVEDVALGWFGPSDPDHPDFGDLWRGALLGLAAVNAQGGYRGKPFRLVPAWSNSPWAAGVTEVTKLASERHVWAVLGGVDGATTHLAEQVALKARFTLLSPGSTDGTANLANVPWMFSLLPSDERVGQVLARAVETASDGGAFVVAAATDHDSHAALLALRHALEERRLAPATIQEFDARGDDAANLAARLLEAQPRVAVVLATARPAARLVIALRRAGFGGRIVGGATLARRAFRRAAVEAADGVVVARLWEATPTWDAFSLAYEARWGEPPDDAAVQSSDAVRLLAAAVRRAGLNRPRIADALRGLSPWAGAAGVVRWDELGRNQRPVGLAVWKDGRLSPIDAALR